jgi:hypothetical protein
MLRVRDIFKKIDLMIYAFFIVKFALCRKKFKFHIQISTFQSFTNFKGKKFPAPIAVMLEKVTFVLNSQTFFLLFCLQPLVSLLTRIYGFQNYEYFFCIKIKAFVIYVLKGTL